MVPQSTCTTVYVPSSELGLPQPLSRKRVCPPLPKGGRRTRLRLRGWGSPNSDDWRKSLALCLLCGWFSSSLLCSVAANIPPMSPRDTVPLTPLTSNKRATSICLELSDTGQRGEGGGNKTVKTGWEKFKYNLVCKLSLKMLRLFTVQ